MKHMPNGIPILKEYSETIKLDDGSSRTFMMRLIWTKGFKWCISTNNWTCSERSLFKCVIMVMRVMFANGQRQGVDIT